MKIMIRDPHPFLLILFLIPKLIKHSVIQGQFLPQAKSKIFNSFLKRFLSRHYQTTDHFFVDFHSNLRTSNYDARAWVNLALFHHGWKLF